MSKTSLQTEVEQLRSSNSRLQSTVQELKLEIAYYKGEAKRLEWEKDLLNKEINKMSSLFKSWVQELNHSNLRSIFDDADYFVNLVKFPCKSISDILQLQNTVHVITSCQAPFFIEYANKAWCNQCGWHPSEILGLTCTFLQGERTNKETVDQFLQDIKEVGYGKMRVKNYRKNGDVFDVTVTVYPIFDSVSATGKDAQIPILTHFASVMSDIVCIEEGTQETEKKFLSHYSTVNQLQKLESIENAQISTTTNASSISKSEKKEYCKNEFESYGKFYKSNISTDDHMNSPSHEEKKSNEAYNKLKQAKQCDAHCHLTHERFLQYGKTLRLSNLLRLMISCVNPIVLTDKYGQIVHVSRGWSQLTGYELEEVEGKTCRILQGPLSNTHDVQVTRKKLIENEIVEMSLINYKKNGSTFMNHVTIIPIRGGFSNPEITHYCGLLCPMDDSSKVTVQEFDVLRHITASAMTSMTYQQSISPSSDDSVGFNPSSVIEDDDMSSNLSSSPYYSEDEDDSAPSHKKQRNSSTSSSS